MISVGDVRAQCQDHFKLCTKLTSLFVLQQLISSAMHTILFQLAILPLTMCRLLISNLWNSPLGKYFPFNEMTKCHIALGYTLVFLLFATIVVFLMFFGVLCNSGAQAFCDKFKTEIIITGYVIFVVSLPSV